MRPMLTLAPLAAFAALGLSSCLTATQSTQALQSLGTGSYHMEKAHSSLIWRLKHMNLSYYTARFTDFDTSLEFDPKNPGASHVKAIINPLSVQADHPTDKDWDRKIGEDFLDGVKFPQIVFESKKIDVTGEFTGKVTGDLSFLGVTKPVTLDVTFNGAAPVAALYQGRSAVGFSAHATFKRSDFGLTRYSSLVGDDVEIIIECEFTK